MPGRGAPYTEPQPQALLLLHRPLPTGLARTQLWPAQVSGKACSFLSSLSSAPAVGRGSQELGRRSVVSAGLVCCLSCSHPAPRTGPCEYVCTWRHARSQRAALTLVQRVCLGRCVLSCRGGQERPSHLVSTSSLPQASSGPQCHTSRLIPSAGGL